MNDKSSSGMPRFFVTKSGMGYEEGVYSQEEIKSLPNAARPHIISLAVAESLGLVVLDHNSGNHINELNAFAAPSAQGKAKKLRGVMEGTPSQPTIVTNTAKKVGNTLRDMLQDVKQKSAEESLKAQIAAKKKQLHSL